MHKRLIQVLQAIMVLTGLLKMPVQLYFGFVDPVAIAEFIHSAFEIATFFRRK